MPFRAVIFDMDGLLIDTEPMYREACQAALAECGFEMSDAQYPVLCGKGAGEVDRTLGELYGPAFAVDAYRARFAAHYERVFAGPIALKPGVHALLDHLDTRPGLLRAICTSTQRVRAIPRLEKVGLLRRFPVVVTGDQVSRGKPWPDLYLLAARTLGVAAVDCLVLEDAEAGVTAAHAAGMMVWMVPDLKQPTDDVRRRAAKVLRSLDEALAELRA